MKALFFDQELVYMPEHPDPCPAAGEALIRVLLAGICKTDLEITRGYMSFRGIPGHEFVGRVEDSNGIPKEWIGRRVVGDINCGCGTCPECLGNHARHCSRRDTLGIQNKNGCFAEYITLPLKNLHIVPKEVSDEAAVFAEPLAAAMQVLEQIQIVPGSEVLVLGDGRLGLLTAMVLQRLPVSLTLGWRHPAKAALAAGFGVHVVPSARLDKDDFDIVVEATGTSQGFTQALSYLKPRGTLVLKSTVADQKVLDLTPVVINEIKIVGSRCGRFQPALQALSTWAEVEPLISGIYPLDRGVEALREAGKTESIKILIDPQFSSRS